MVERKHPINRHSQNIYERPVELLQNLIRFDTTNPPGNEAPCVNYIDSLLNVAGFETTILAKETDRPNLITRLAGSGQAPPLLLYGHVDVVTTAKQQWRQPPFEGKEADGYIWGRGALDMKGGLAMMLAALMRARAEGVRPAGDIILAILSDEETAGDCGAGYLVAEHAGQFQGVRYAIGEFGGFPLHIGGRKFYGIQVAEKHFCWLNATVRGPGGHASLPMRDSATAALARLLTDLSERRLPVHITPVVRQMIEQIASAVPPPMKSTLIKLLEPSQTDTALEQLGSQQSLFDALLHNTVNATIIRGGQKINVVPSEISIKLDGRLLPGYIPEDLMAELRPIVGQNVELELIRCDPGPAAPDMGLFDTLAGIIREADPTGIPLPVMVAATTDARFFSRLGIQTYGYTPMNLPPDFSFAETIHAADERIPLAAVGFGAAAIFRVIKDYG
jgi:acetylornithine deacetylase/succinyl-diaminopimelate desuccinylase-like protein